MLFLLGVLTLLFDGVSIVSFLLLVLNLFNLLPDGFDLALQLDLLIGELGKEQAIERKNVRQRR